LTKVPQPVDRPGQAGVGVASLRVSDDQIEICDGGVKAATDIFTDWYATYAYRFEDGGFGDIEELLVGLLSSRKVFRSLSVIPKED
jgi:hypothetical protein